MAALDRKVRKLQWRTSKARLFSVVFLMILVFTSAVFVRYYAVEPLLLNDTAMGPRIKKGSLIWTCRLPQCIEKIRYNDIVWASLPNHETIVRKVIGEPGDSIEISDKGRVKTKHKRFMWRGEDSFIESRKFYVPKLGDTIILSQLNDIEEDYTLKLMSEQGIVYTTKTTLWQGSREINTERVGSTKLGNRPVSLQELDVLPWQDRRLIEMQIRQAEPGNAPIKLKRQFFAPGDSIPLDTIIITKDCYYLTCEKGKHCVDSRELGYFTKDQILGRHIKQPDIVKKIVLNKVEEIRKKVFTPASKKIQTQIINKIKVETEAVNIDKVKPDFRANNNIPQKARIKSHAVPITDSIINKPKPTPKHTEEKVPSK